MADKKPTLTDLALHHEQLSKELIAHTHSRNYLYTIMTGESTMPVIKTVPMPGEQTSTNVGVMLDLTKVAPEVADTIISTMLEHEERAAFMVWEQLQMVTKAACQSIVQYKAEREAAMKRAAQVEESPATIPIHKQELGTPHHGGVNE